MAEVQRELPEWEVEVAVDVEAESPRAAAEVAYTQLTDPVALAWVCDVRRRGASGAPTGGAIRVDLMDEEDEGAPAPDPHKGAVMSLMAAHPDLAELDLDEPVHEMASSHAGEVNNAGLEAQLRYLIEQVGEEAVRGILDERSGGLR